MLYFHFYSLCLILFSSSIIPLSSPPPPPALSQCDLYYRLIDTHILIKSAVTSHSPLPLDLEAYWKNDGGKMRGGEMRFEEKGGGMSLSWRNLTAA